MNQGLQIDVYSHHFQVSNITAYYGQAIENFSDRLTEIDIVKDGWGNITREPVRMYAQRMLVGDTYTYRFHINIYDEFVDFMNSKGIQFPNVITHDIYIPGTYAFKLKPGWDPFENQIPVIDYLASPGTKKVIDAATGSGKTVMTLMALAKINQRTVLVVKPMYIGRWLDVAAPGNKQAMMFNRRDVMTVRGGSQLRSVILLARDNELHAKFIIISNRTLTMYYENYKEFGETEEYGFVKPEELWQLLDVGVRLIDEAHEHFHACFISDLNSHVPKSIELSGTLEPDDVFMRRMYEIMYPHDLRMNTGKREKYIQLYALNYQLSEHPKPIRTTRRGRSSYSQAAYEENILKVPKRKDNFVNMISDVVETWFMSEKLPDYKLLMFFDTVDACALIADTLAKVYPDLKVSKYTQEEKASVLDECDIIVATPGSAGTAVDITNLQMVISFVMRSSSQALIQYIGRLRQLKTDKVQPKYIYMYTRNIHTHIKYDLKMQDVYKNIVMSSENLILNHTI